MRSRGFAYALVAVGIVVAGLVLFAGFQTHRARTAIAELAAYKAQAEAEVARLLQLNAEVGARVVIEYRDRVRVIREQGPEVIREIEVIRNSGCVLPGEFRLLHDRSAGASVEAPAGVDAAPAPVDCATAAEVIRDNYLAARENAVQLEALQKWAASVSSP